MSEATRSPKPDDLRSASLAEGAWGEANSSPGASLSSPEVRTSLLLGPAGNMTLLHDNAVAGKADGMALSGAHPNLCHAGVACVLSHAQKRFTRAALLTGLLQ